MTSRMQTSPERVAVGHRPASAYVVLLALLVCGLGAADRTWVGLGADNNWSNNANWSGGQRPGAFDNAIFSDASVKPCTMDIGVDIQNLTVTSGYTGDISGPSSDMTIRGAIVQDGAAITVRNLVLHGGRTRTTGTMTVGGTTSLTGVIPYVVNGVGMTTGYLYVESGATASINDLYVVQLLANAGNLTIGPGNTCNHFYNGYTPNSGNNYSSALSISGALSVIGNTNPAGRNYAEMTVLNGGQLHFTQPNHELSVSGASSKTTVNGHIVFSSERLSPGYSIYLQDMVQNFVINGDITLANGHGLYVSSGCALEVNGTLNMGNGTFRNAGAMEVSASGTVDLRSVGLGQYANSGVITENGILRKPSLGVSFTDLLGQRIASLTPGDPIIITCLDGDGNLNGSVVDALSVVVSSAVSGDSETLVLTETGLDSMTFRNNGFPSNVGSAVLGDGILQFAVGENLQVTYTDSKDLSDTCDSFLQENPAILWSGSAGDGKWSTPGNWVGGQVPGPFDIATFDGSGVDACTLDVGADLQGLVINAGYTGSIAGTQDLTIRGELIQNGSSLSVRNLVLYGGATRTAGTMAVSGGLTCRGPLAYTINGSGLTTGTVEIAQGTTVTFTSLQAGSTTWNLGTLTVDGGNLVDVYNGYNPSTGYNVGARMTILGAVTCAGSRFGNSAELIIATGATLALSRHDGVFGAGDYAGSSAVIDGSLQFTSTVDNPSAGLYLSSDMSELTVNGTVSMSGGQRLQIGTWAILNINGEVTVGSGPFTNGGHVGIADGATLDCRRVAINQWTNTADVIESGTGKVLRWSGGVAFTNAVGQTLVTVTPGDGIFITCLDDDGNTTTTIRDPLLVTVESLTTGDSEVVTLTETGDVSMIFRNTAPLPTALGAAVIGDGVVQMQAQENLRVTYTDSRDAADTISYLLFDSPAPIITSAASAAGTQGQAFDYRITAINSPWSFDATGLPAGLTVNTTTGQISGTPTVPGLYAVTLSATNPAGTGTQALSLSVAPPVPTITSALSGVGAHGVAFTYQIVSTPAADSYGAVGLPAGLGVDTVSGEISGTPTAFGSFAVTLQAINGSGTGTATLALTIHPPAPVISSATVASGQVGAAFTYQILASNSPAGYGATGLPAGLSCHPGSGLISGVPVVAGVYSVTLSATNGGGTGTASLILSVTAGPPSVSGVSPGNGSTLGGTMLTITGANLATTTAVTVGGSPATGLLLDGPEQIRCTTPAGVAGLVDVVVTTPSGTTTAVGAFTYQTPVIGAPVITAVTPGTGDVGGGTAVTITGSALSGTTGVTIGGAAATAVIVDHDGQVRCTAPAGVVGAADVVVTTAGGSTTAVGGFTYAVAGAKPDVAVNRGGTAVANGGTDTLGPVVLDTATNLVYVLENTGGAPLHTAGAASVVTLLNCSAAFTALPASTVAAGGQTTLGVAVTPSGSPWSCTVAIATDDADENPCTWTIAGTAAAGTTGSGQGSANSGGGGTSCGAGAGALGLFAVLGLVSGRPRRRFRPFR